MFFYTSVWKGGGTALDDAHISASVFHSCGKKKGVCLASRHESKRLAPNV